MAVSTVEVLVTPAVEQGVDPADPFRYGWRPVRRVGPADRESWERAPLTLEDVLHPREGDQVTQNDAHERRCRYLADVFEAQLAGDPTAVVLHDVRVAWDVPDLKPHGPDIAVILGVRARRSWSTFDVAAEGARPALIVEVTSPETAGLDRLIKHDEYELAGVPLYVVVDMVPRRRLPPLRLLGHTLTPDGYRELAPDARGRLWLPPARAWLGIDSGEIVCYDEADRPLGDYRALAAALADERQARADVERRIEDERRARADAEGRAAAAEARLQELEAELRRLRREG